MRTITVNDVRCDVDHLWTRTRELTVVMDDANHDKMMTAIGTNLAVDFHLETSAIFMFHDMICHKRSIAGKNIVTFLEDSDL